MSSIDQGVELLDLLPARRGQEPVVAGHQPQIVFDRYHVVAKANEAACEVRRAESKTRPELGRVSNCLCKWAGLIGEPDAVWLTGRRHSHDEYIED